MNSTGMTHPSRSVTQRFMASPANFTPLASSSSASFGSSTRVTVNGCAFSASPAFGFRVPRSDCSPISTSVTSPLRTSALNSL